MDSLDAACHTYQKCLQMLRSGRGKEVEETLALLEEQEPRYARDLARKLEIARRWEEAGDNPHAKQAFWDWLDSEPELPG